MKISSGALIGLFLVLAIASIGTITFVLGSEDDSQARLIVSQQTLIDALHNEVAAKDNLIKQLDLLIDAKNRLISVLSPQEQNL